MIEAWVRPVEQIVLPALEGQVRVIGITAPNHGAGATTLCEAIAETLSKSGIKVLLLDLTRNVVPEGDRPGWLPGETPAVKHIIRHASGFDTLTAHPTSKSRFLFNNGKRLRLALKDELAEYGVIIIDLPVLLDQDTNNVNPVTAALVCDSVLMVCGREHTPREALRSAAELARSSGIKLTGVVYNELGKPSVGTEIACSLDSISRFAPNLIGWLQRRVAASPLLR